MKSIVTIFVLLLACSPFMFINASDTEINFYFADMLAGMNSTSGSTNPTTDAQTCSVRTNTFSSSTPTVFAALNTEEIKSILDYFYNIRTDLNVTPYIKDTTTLSDNIIHHIETFLPPKSQVLSYLDSNGPFPGRYARVVIYRGSVPDVIEYQVGPIPTFTTFEVIRTAGWLSRAPDALEYAYIDQAVVKASNEIDSLMKESFAGYSYGGNCGNFCLTYTDTAPRGISPGQRESWFWFLKNVPGKYLQTVGIEFCIDHRGQTADSFFLKYIIYNGVSFNSTQDLINAYNQPGFPKINYSNSPDFINDTWSSFTPRGESSFSENFAPPRSYEPEGHRWNVIGENKIAYYDWEFEFSTRPTTSFNIWNAVYKNKRIAYEISMQDTLSSYAGLTSAAQSRTIYQDPAWGLGTSFFELGAGVDCPTTAQFLDYDAYYSDGVHRFRNSICVFEMDLGIPLKRHYETDFAGSYTFYAGAPAYALVIRSITAVYNYDYLIDYVFYPHGAIEAKVGLGGYIQATHYNPSEDPYGERVRDFTMGTIHDHILHYKLDLDVEGTANTFERAEAVVEQINQPWFADRPHYQKRLVRTFIENENNSAIKYDFNRPSWWYIVNRDVQNAWGINKSLRVSATSMLKNIVVEAGDPITSATVSWSRYQFAVTKYHDNEPFSASPYSQATPLQESLQFDDFFDGEDINQTDIVAWVSIGMMHLPISEDIPTQALIGNTASIWIRPNNMFDEDPSMSLKGTFITTPTGVQYDGRLQGKKDCLPSEQITPFDGNWPLV